VFWQISRRFDPIRHRSASQIGFVLPSFVPKTTLPALFSSIYPPFFASFLQNEPNSYFTQPIHVEIVPHFSVGFVWQKHPFLKRTVPTIISKVSTRMSL